MDGAAEKRLYDRAFRLNGLTAAWHTDGKMLYLRPLLINWCFNEPNSSVMNKATKMAAKKHRKKIERTKAKRRLSMQAAKPAKKK